MEVSDEEETQESNNLSKKNKISSNLFKKLSSRRIKSEDQRSDEAFQQASKNLETYASALKGKWNDETDFGNFVVQKLRNYDKLTQSIIRNEIITVFLNADRKIYNVS